MNRRADTIKASAKLAGQKMRDIDGRHSYAAEAGALSAHVDLLCDEIAAYTGANHKPSKGARTATLFLGDAEVLVEYDYQPGEPAVYDLNSPMCGPGCGAYAEIGSVLINGQWIDPTFIDSGTLSRWEDELCDREEEAARDALTEFYEANTDDGRKTVELMR